MNAPGKTMLKVSSIILIVLGSLGVLGSACSGLSLLLVKAIPIDQFMEQVPESTISMWNYARGAITAAVVIALVLGGVTNLMELIFGIMGLRNCDKPEKGAFFIGTGVALIALFIACIALRGGLTVVITVLSLALPILFIVGGVMNNKAVAVAEPSEPVQ
jgi:hypothetical protein